MIYDCFTFFKEFDLLKIRCEELKPLNVNHVLVECTHTFTGKPKPLFFKENYDEFRGYNIIHGIINNSPNNGNAWDNEKFQRNNIMLGLENCNDSDIVIIGDADEIPRAQAIKNYHIGMGQTALVMDKFGYFLNCIEGKQSWKSSRIMPYSYLKDKTPDEVRNSGYDNQIEHAGWHWSYLGGVEAIRNKLDSFSHQECNTPKLNNEEVLKHKLEIGQSLWSNEPHDLWPFMEIDDSFPEYVQKNKEQFSHLIKQI